MKTVDLVVGLFQLLGWACCWWTLTHSDSVGVILLFTALAVVNGVCGLNSVLEALFGDGGFFPLFGRK